MPLVEATKDDLPVLIERWYDLAKDMEEYSELNELAFVDFGYVPETAFREHFDDEMLTDYLVVEEDRTIGFLTVRNRDARRLFKDADFRPKQVEYAQPIE